MVKLLGVGIYVGQLLVTCRLSLQLTIEGYRAAGPPLANTLSSIGLLLIGLLASSLLITVGYRLSLSPGTDLIADNRSPILLLRSFKDDARYDYNPQGLVAYALGLKMPLAALLGPVGNLFPTRMLRLLAQISADTSEEQLGQALSRHGGLITMGRPGELIPLGGAARMYASDDNWRTMIRDLLERARFVILQPGESESIWWEIEEVFHRVARDRVIISLLHFQRAPARWELFRIRMQERVGVSLPISVMDALFIGFDRNGAPFPLAPVHRSAATAAFHGCCIDIESTLAPVLGAQRRVGIKAPPRGLSLLVAGLVFNGALFGTDFLARRVVSARVLAYDARSQVAALARSTLVAHHLHNGLTVRLPAGWRELGVVEVQRNEWVTGFALGVGALAMFDQIQKGDPLPGDPFPLFGERVASLTCPTPEVRQREIANALPPGANFEQVSTLVDRSGRTWTELEFHLAPTLTHPAMRFTRDDYCDGERVITVMTVTYDSVVDLLAPAVRQVRDAIQ